MYIRDQGSDAGNSGEVQSTSERWLTIDAACKLLGVDKSTLRRWSDAGRVPVFRTPGGHRRYSETDLQRLLSGKNSSQRPMNRSALQRLSMSAYEVDYLRKAHEHRWYRSYSEEQLEELRILGRRLIDFATRTIADIGPDEVLEIYEEGRRIGRRYGSISADAGLSPTDAVEAFLFFRYPVFASVTRFIEQEQVSSRRAMRAFADISRFMDNVMIATMQAHSDRLSES